MRRLNLALLAALTLVGALFTLPILADHDPGHAVIGAGFDCVEITAPAGASVSVDGVFDAEYESVHILGPGGTIADCDPPGPTPTPTPTPTPSPSVFASGFESGDFSDFDHTVFEGGCSGTVSAEAARTGVSGFVLTSDGSNDDCRVRHDLETPAAHAFSRYYVQFVTGQGSSYLTSGQTWMTCFESSCKSLVSGARLVDGDTRCKALIMGFGANIDCDADGADYVWPTGSWVCVETEVNWNPGGTQRIWADGVLVLELAEGVRDGSAMQSVSWGSDHSDPPGKWYYDDVAISTTGRVGC